MVALRLAKEGFCRGDFQAIRASPTPDVLAMLTYVNFVADYGETAGELNRAEASH